MSEAGVHERGARPTLAMAVLAISVAGYATAGSALLPALPQVQTHYDTSPAAAAWVFTAYMLVSAPATPLAGRLGDMYGRRPVLLGALVIFTLGSMGSALSHSLPTLIAFRAVQGLGSSVIPSAFGLARDILPPEKRAVGIALIGAMTAVGGSIGLPLGGFVVQHAPLETIFWISAGCGVIMFVAAFVGIPHTTVRSPGRLDVVGAAVLAVVLVVPLLGVSMAPSWGWLDPRTLSLIGVGVVGLPCWWWMESRRSSPLVNTRLLSQRSVAAIMTTTMLMGLGLFGTFSLLPRLAQAPTDVGGLGFNAFVAGALLLPTAGVNAVVAPIVGMISRTLGGQLPLCVGCLVAAAGLGWLALRHDTALEVAVGCAILGVGFAAALAAGPIVIVNAVSWEETGAALAANTLAQNIGSSVGSQVGVTIVVAHTRADGWLSAGYTWAFAAAAMGALAGALMAFVAREPRRAGLALVDGALIEPPERLDIV